MILCLFSSSQDFDYLNDGLVTVLTESSKPEMPMPDAAAVPAKPMKWPELVIIVEIMMSYKYPFNIY